PSTNGLCPLSLHDALPIDFLGQRTVAIDHFLEHLGDLVLVEGAGQALVQGEALGGFADVLVGNERGQIDTELGIPFVDDRLTAQDRKSTRLNSSHVKISYA